MWVFACILDFCVYDFNMQIQIFNVGDFVSVRIPRIDRSSTDSHRLPCVIVERLGETFHLYRLTLEQRRATIVAVRERLRIAEGHYSGQAGWHNINA